MRREYRELLFARVMVYRRHVLKYVWWPLFSSIRTPLWSPTRHVWSDNISKWYTKGTLFWKEIILRYAKYHTIGNLMLNSVLFWSLEVDLNKRWQCECNYGRNYYFLVHNSRVHIWNNVIYDMWMYVLAAFCRVYGTASTCYINGPVKSCKIPAFITVSHRCKYRHCSNWWQSCHPSVATSRITGNSTISSSLFQTYIKENTKAGYQYTLWEDKRRIPRTKGQ